MSETFDFVVIGGGAAGEAAAITAAGRGATVALVERDLVGGSCPFWACMPSKSLLHAASVHAQGGRYPWERAAERRDVVIDRDPAESLPSDASHVRDLTDAGVALVRGAGRLTGPGAVAVTGPGDERSLRASVIVIATGSVPLIPEIDGLDAVKVWTSREATATRTLPGSLVVIGAGATGVELAQAFTRYGVPTALLASGPRIFPKGHPRNSAALEARLRHDGVRVRTGVRAVHARAMHARSGRGPTRSSGEIELSDGTSEAGEVVLAAVGRSPQLAGLGLETIGIDPSRPPDVHDDLRIAEGVFIAGDAAGGQMHSHLADHQGRLAVRIALGEDVRPDWRAIPRVVYSDPQIAEVGLQLGEARAAGLDVQEATVDLANTAKGIASEATGHVTIVIDRAAQTLLGAFIAGPAAAEVISEAALAIRMALPLRAVADTIHPFPTLARVLGDLIGEAIADRI